ncbi:MAG: copper homeostasis protein CutC [Micrococcales bacterium]|nr:copper homeostasis protein CutC [Micrococcales bacterium]
MTALEIVVQDPAGAAIAHAVNADRVELCAALGTGGLTASAGCIALTSKVGIEVHTLIRPRAGGFVFTPGELAVQVEDVARAVQLGASGVVIGALNSDQTIDTAAVRALVAAAGDHEVTYHRAFDIVDSPFDALEQLVDLGVTRVLTSGQAPRCSEGLDALAALVVRAAGRIQIQAGGGIKIEDIPAIAATGVDAVHLSARGQSSQAGPAGPGGGVEALYDITDAEAVAAAAQALR